MSGGAVIIIIDPNRVQSSLSPEDTAAQLRASADALEAGAIELEAPQVSKVGGVSWLDTKPTE